MFFKADKKNSQTPRLPEELRRSIAGYIDAHYISAVAYGRNVEECYKVEAQVLCKRLRTEAVEAIPAPCASSLEELLRQADAGFTETLLKLIDERGKKDSQVYKKANLSKQHFSKIRNNPHYRPTKPTAIALALALELDLEQTKELIGRAGYALSNSSKFDLIIRYFIERKNYNIAEINMALYEFDQTLLGV